MKASAKYHDCVHCVIGEKTFTNILIRGPFLESPGNLPGPISVFGDNDFSEQKSIFVSFED